MTGKEIIAYEKRVEKGVKWLDKTFGRKNWSKKIKPKVLDLGDSYKCMIGEVTGEYGNLEDKYGVTDEKAYDMGFCQLGGGDYSVLTSVWMCALKALGIRK